MCFVFIGSYGRDAGVRRGLGVGIGRLGVIVGIAVGVGGHMATGVGPYLPPVFNENEVLLSPPQTTISLAVHTAV